MARLYLSLDKAADKVAKMFNYETPNDKEWVRDELEQVCEVRTCNNCRGTTYTNECFTVITQMHKKVEVVFNFCPVCGRDLRPGKTNIWGGE